MLDVLVVGAGPAGRAVAAACGERGLCTRMLDPAPHRPWRAHYGAWLDELPPDLPRPLLATVSRGFAAGYREHRLDRTYAMLDVPALRAHLDDRLAAAGVGIDRGRVRPGELPPAGVVIDAGGPAQPLSRPEPRGPRSPAEQTAVGVVVPAELAEPLLPPEHALFMDWRPLPDWPEADWASCPTFLYAVPVARDRVLLEETSLARRPGLDFARLTERLRARLAAHRIVPPADAPRELVRFRLDVPRHRAPGVLGFGAAAPLTHPATGYQLATALRLAPAVARAIATGLADGPRQALAEAMAALWPPSARLTHLLRRRGLASLLRLPAGQLPAFFDGFFALPDRRQVAYLSGRTDPIGTAAAMASMFHTTDWPVRLRLIGGSLAVSLRTSAPARSAKWRNVR